MVCQTSGVITENGNSSSDLASRSTRHVNVRTQHACDIIVSFDGRTYAAAFTAFADRRQQLSQLASLHGFFKAWKTDICISSWRLRKQRPDHRKRCAWISYNHCSDDDMVVAPLRDPEELPMASQVGQQCH